jgi:hypothetical protein
VTEGICNVPCDDTVRTKLPQFEVTVLKNTVQGPYEEIKHPEKGQDVGSEFKKNIDQSPMF